MPTFTPNYNLKKPGNSEAISIEDINANMDVLDEAVGEIEGRFEGAKVKQAKQADSAVTAGSAGSVPWSGIPDKPATFPPSSHTHPASQMTAGTLAGQVVANATAVATQGTAQVRNIRAGTADMTPGSTTLANGEIYLVYE